MASRRLAAGLVLLAPFLFSAGANTVDDVVLAVRTALEQRQSDAQLARSLHRLNLREKLDIHSAEELESEVPGPLAVAELERLRALSRDLPDPAVPPRFAAPPDPSAKEQQEVIAQAGQAALAYDKSLPDFLCTETIRRYQAPRHTADLSLYDTLTVQLSYFEEEETYWLIAVDGHPTTLTLNQVTGSFSTGEFGSVLFSLFAPGSATDFRWDHWTTLRKRPAYVFRFQILAANSTYKQVVVDLTGRQVSTIVGQHGFVYIDRETRQVVRLISAADTIPENFPMRLSARELDYGLAAVGGRDYLLPLRADVRMVTNGNPPVTRNEIEFRDYRKFSGESTISFGDDPAPPPKKK